MTSNRTLNTVTVLAALLGPGLTVLGTRLVVQRRQPSLAAAAPAPAHPATTNHTASLQPPTPAEQIQLARLRAEAAKPTPAQPFYTAPAEQAAPRDEKPTAHARRGAEHQLTSILRGTQLVAVINGKLCRVGDRLGGDFTLAAIDPDAGTATLDSPAQGRLTLKLQRAREFQGSGVRERPALSAPTREPGTAAEPADEPVDEPADEPAGDDQAADDETGDRLPTDER